MQQPFMHELFFAPQDSQKWWNVYWDFISRIFHKYSKHRGRIRKRGGKKGDQNKNRISRELSEENIMANLEPLNDHTSSLANLPSHLIQDNAAKTTPKAGFRTHPPEAGPSEIPLLGRLEPLDFRPTTFPWTIFLDFLISYLCAVGSYFRLQNKLIQ